MNFVLLVATLGLLKVIVMVQSQELDTLMAPFRLAKLEAFNLVSEYVENPDNMLLLRQQNKLQKFFKRRKNPCPLNNTRSPTIPDSVHKLRPGDIDVIAAIGDSLSAGVGLLATRTLHVFIEHRGIAPTAGGKSSWRRYLTVPNILKTFNPNLTGYATETSLTLHWQSQLNVAETGAVSEDTPYMTKLVLKRMRAHPKINMAKHWKMISFMIGPNDFCSQICYHNNVTQILEKHRQELLQVLTTLKENSPRTIVNLIPPPNVALLTEFTKKSQSCSMSHMLECPCLFGLFESRRPIYFDLIKKWQEIDVEVGNSDFFDSEDFTVVVQPFSLDFHLPKTEKGYTDYSYLSEDCFHMSQKGNARIANSLWNNILQPVGGKSTKPRELEQGIRCPTLKNPYIYTRRNSRT